MLTEIRRPAAESAIILLATMAQQGTDRLRGVRPLRREDAQGRRDARPGAALRAAHLRHERHPASAQQRHARMPRVRRGRAAIGSGEKIICLKNQNDIGLINGMFVTLEDVVDEGSLFFSAVVKDEGGKPFCSHQNATGRRGGFASTRGTSRTISGSTASGTTGTGARSAS